MIYGDPTRVPICLHRESLTQTFPKQVREAVLGDIKKGLGKKTLENIQQGATQNGSPENQLTVT